ncbi:hypothetical protein QFZ79_001135 [Arthrobacter sp. V4I6]|uniref:hypothetical protein n=1 Tax=unclassified Arthrobacter TaxID=235627 RepID=UPI00277E9960|nr:MULTISPECIES: hypothetical protein [unclassified Arthrobacter]MDQ0823392.1 hypothetical protein [Arthrobacter sp. V1I7]MDQ0853024.1 hypothetical protein [Arthrobacter sp. V4I6]
MKPRLAALSAAALMIVLTGCGQVQEAAEKAVSDGASQVATAAGNEVKKQACALVEDGLVSIQDKELLGGLVAGAETAGLPSDITTPLRQIAESGDQVPAESVKALQDACAK